ncbi:MAG: bifunctional acetate--CoA ligase family protein/GNAT family N-acetyltransferase [Alphaproteobacteria bacterium]|nr:bifunctional acetate--CoA ligase family protein/GNAT family N-acetyltransferase [Alphaproteobacteria bacterium]
MSTRNLDAVLKPRSIALVGASTRPRSVGAVVAGNLRRAGFAGELAFVNPHAATIEGLPCLPDVAQLPAAPDLAIIATPPETVPGLVGALGARGTRGIVVLTAGFGELGSERGRALQQAILDAARPHLVRIVGPNCVGVLSPGLRVNASFAHVTPAAGNLAFVTQSGAVATSVLDWAGPRNIGFSHIVSLGDMIDIDFGDLLDWLANDVMTRGILLYVETITHARKFMSAARAAARLKPVIVIKAGRHAAAAKAAASHTGALAGSDAVYDAAFRRAGMVRVDSLAELFDAVETIAHLPALRGERLAIVTNGGGLGVLATDSLMDLRGELAELSAETVARLDTVLPRTWPHGNPIDIIGDADAERYERALDIVLAAPEIDATLVINCPTAVADSAAAADATIAAAKRHRRVVLTSWVGEGAQVEARRHLTAAGLATFATPNDAVRGFMHAVSHKRSREALMEVPPAAASDGAPIDIARARRAIEAARDAGRPLLMAHETLELLAAYGIPAVQSRVAASSAKAAAIAAALSKPLALKLLSPDITHKSDVGGVMLNVSGAESMRMAAETMAARVHAAFPDARIEGFLLQEMVNRRDAHELIVGLSTDRQFGPVVMFGQGGVSVEVVKDTALALPPLNHVLARELMNRTRIIRLLRGYRDRPAAALDAIAEVLIRIAQIAADHAEVQEIDINPLLADADGVLALDGRVRLDLAARGPGAARFAIRPYPSELAAPVDAIAGAMLRPIRPEDAEAIEALFDRLDPEDVRLRFFAPVRELPRATLARLTQIDYDREMALVLEQRPGELIGVVRIACDPDNTHAEFAVVVRSDLKGRGLGRLLMERIIAYARGRGVGEITGDILRENTNMLALARELGFTIVDDPEAREIVRARLALR